MQPDRIWTRKQCADHRRVYKSTITRACAGPLAPACEGDRVNIDHPAAVDYFARHGTPVPPRPHPTPQKLVQRNARAQPPPADPSAHQPEPEPEPSPGVPPNGGREWMLPPEMEGEDPAFFGPMTLDRVAREYGSMTRFKDVVDVVRTIEVTRTARLKNQQLEGTLIARELVEHALGLWERYHRNLLRPVIETITRTTATELAAKKPIEEIEKTNKKIAARELKAAIAAVSRMLTKAGG